MQFLASSSKAGSMNKQDVSNGLVVALAAAIPTVSVLVLNFLGQVDSSTIVGALVVGIGTTLVNVARLWAMPAKKDEATK